MMKKTNVFLLLGILFLLGACDEENVEDNDVATAKDIIVKVINASSWEQRKGSNPDNLEIVANAMVYLTRDSITLSEVTNEDGLAIFRDVTFDSYYVKAASNELNSLVEPETKEGVEMGYLVTGVYTSASEIDNGPEPGKTVGEIKLFDINNDGIINPNDKVEGKPISFEGNYLDLNGDGIINEEDKYNGEYVEENTLTVKVYVGKK